MVKRLVLLISLLVIIFFGVSTQVKKNESRDSKQEVLTKKPAKLTQDKLLEWMSFMKSESGSYRDQGDVLKAIQILTRCIDARWREPITLEEHEKLAWIYTNRAYLYHQQQGDYLAAKEDYLAGLKQFELCEPSDYLVARYVFQPLGNIYTRLGENEIAISMLGKFKRACEDSGDTEALMNAYNDIGRAYVNTGELGKGIALMTEGIALDETDDFSLGLLYSSKAEAEEESERFDQSSISAEKCIYHVNRVIRNTDTTDFHHRAAKQYKIAALKAKAKVLGHSQSLKEAHEMYVEALSLTEEVYPEKHRARGRALVELGNSYDALEMKVEAMVSYQLSLQSMVDGISTGGFSDNPTKSELYADVVIGEALIQKGIIAHDVFTETGESSWLNVSVNAYLCYFDWVEIHRSEQFEFDTKLETAKEVHLIGELALAAIFDLCEETQDQRWIDRAFVLMDQTKAIVLAEERGFKDLANNNPEMRSLLKEQNALKFQRSLFKSDIQKAEKNEDAADVLRLKKRLSEIDQKSQLLDQEVRSLFPAYRTQSSAKLEGEIAKQLKKKLKSRNAEILSYFVGDDWVYAITGSPDKFKFTQIERKIVTEGVNEFMTELNSPNTSTPEKYGRSGNVLFDLLLGELKNSTTNLVIFPDGVLNSLPFEALVSNVSKGTNSFKKMNYVVRDHVIHYSPSAYFFAHDELRGKAEKSFLGIAPVFRNSNSYDFLPKSLEELESGAALFSGNELKEEEATKSHFFRDAEQYDILHISTHAGRNSGENNDAWMVFSDVKSKDHRLIATELLKLDLPASLVVLNACETGSGTVFKGEGPMSLARGFLDAGSQSTVTNLWRVNHESNALIMKSFYEKLSETQSPSRSLNAAKLDYLSNGEVDEASAHPYFWSSAILIGTDVSVVSPSSPPMALWVWTALGSVLILVLGIAWFRKKRKAVGEV
ncbi:MAG: CHAT domain-containing protein [Crocinitomicaceae bacterium]|nr:CHAT domain-containing protein [Flavobacteriales bacterium]NQZ35891.1 CHAT domain-containing protein [Crocinitomicaceae bacterium]